MRALLAESPVGAISLTLGANGAALATRDELLRAPAHPVAERSTVGAGDAFVAAYVLRTMQGRSAAEALRAGLAAGAAVAAMPGTAAPNRELVERLERGG
jgi:6-phosphofructokinase 2